MHSLGTLSQNQQPSGLQILDPQKMCDHKKLRVFFKLLSFREICSITDNTSGFVAESLLYHLIKDARHIE